MLFKTLEIKRSCNVITTRCHEITFCHYHAEINKVSGMGLLWEYCLKNMYFISTYTLYLSTYILYLSTYMQNVFPQLIRVIHLTISFRVARLWAITWAHEWPITSEIALKDMDKINRYFVHNSDVIMSTMASQITGVSIVYSNVCSGADQTKTSKLWVTGLCGGNSPVSGEFPAQGASNAENVPIWWRHHGHSKVQTSAIW